MKFAAQKVSDIAIMERNQEELQFLGVSGIMSEAFNILRSCAKLLGAITLTLLLPLSCVILSHSLISDRLFRKIFLNELYFEMEAGRPAAEKTLHTIYLEWTEVFVFEAAYLTLVLALSLLSTAAVVYTVASIYTAKELCYTRVMSVVPRVWKRLLRTFLWYFTAMFAYCVAVVFSIFLWIVLLDLGKLNRPSFKLGLLVITAVSFSVNVYISTIWQLASVVSVVEEKYGLGAMKKSKDLIKGERVTASALFLFYLMTMGIIEWLFDYAVVHGDRHEVGAGERSVYGIMLAVLQCAVNLMGLLVQSVFYFVCKSYHCERIDKLGLSDHLEAYFDEYMPLKDSSIQLEPFMP